MGHQVATRSNIIWFTGIFYWPRKPKLGTKKSLAVDLAKPPDFLVHKRRPLEWGILQICQVMDSFSWDTAESTDPPIDHQIVYRPFWCWHMSKVGIFLNHLRISQKAPKVLGPNKVGSMLKMVQFHLARPPCWCLRPMTNTPPLSWFCSKAIFLGYTCLSVGFRILAFETRSLVAGCLLVVCRVSRSFVVVIL